MSFPSFQTRRCLNGAASDHSTQAGFTLIELLVVLVLLALFMGMAVLTIGDNLQRKLLSEAERLQAIMIAAADEAIYTGNELGIYLNDDGYQVLRWERLTNQWKSIPSQAFARYKLPEGIAIEWSVDGFVPPDDSRNVEFKLGESDEDSLDFLPGSGEEGDKTSQEDAAEGVVVDAVPQLLLLSSSELSVFELEFFAAELEGKGDRVRLYSDGFALPMVRLIGADEEQGAI